jgi:hypothetical protein
MSNNVVGYSGIAVNRISNVDANEDANFGKLAYVNRLGTAYKYDDASLINYTDKYVSNPGYTIKDISSNKNVTRLGYRYFYDNSNDSVARCEKHCSNTGSCIGSVIDETSCYMIRKLDTKDVVYKNGAIMTLRVPGINKMDQTSYTVYPESKIPSLSLPATPIVTNSANECLNICNNTPGCNSFQIDRNSNGTANCYTTSFNDPKKLGENNKYTTYYTDDNGTRKILFDIVKKFEGPLENKEGLPIDVYLDWIMQEGKYQTEYLVTPELLDQVMERAGCRLIESDTFLNIYTLNHQYFTQVIEHEENIKNYKYETNGWTYMDN